jgi:hypothetical protein
MIFKKYPPICRDLLLILDELASRKFATMNYESIK